MVITVSIKENKMTDQEVEAVFDRARKALIEGLKALEDMKTCKCERCTPVNDFRDKQEER